MHIRVHSGQVISQASRFTDYLGSMLDHRLRRWPNLKPTLVYRVCWDATTIHDALEQHFAYRVNDLI